MNQTIYRALRARLNTLPNKPQIAYENEDYKPKQNVLWLRESFLPAEIDPFTLTDSQQYNGLYQVTVFAPLEQGAAKAQTQAEAIVAHFERGTVVGQGKVLAASYGPAIASSAWFQIPITIRYRAHYRD
jgi:hypothetical protein